MIPIKPLNPYWYLYVLLFFYLICIKIEKNAFSEKYKLIILYIISALGALVPGNAIFSLRNLLLNIAFFYLGIVLAKEEGLLVFIRKPVVVACSGFATLLIFIMVFFMKCNLLNIYIWGVIVALTISIFFIGLFACLKCNNKILKLIGKYSLEIYVTHCFITAANRIILIKVGLSIFGVNILVNTLMAIFIPIGCSIILKKINLHTLVFRPFTYISEKRSR